MAERSHPARRRPWGVTWPLIALATIIAIGVWRFLTPRRGEQTAAPVVADLHGHRGDIRSERANSVTAFEPSDWNLQPLALIYAGMLALLAISCLAVLAAYPHSLADVERTLRIAPPGPRLLIDSRREFLRVRAEEERRLHGYYWIDRPRGVVHIPIEQTMQKLARTGIPGFGEGQ